MNSKKTAALDVVTLVSRALDAKKAEALTILNVSSASSITDYLVIATATSEPHLRALRIEVEKVLDSAAVHLVGVEAAQESGWLVIDAFDVMVHLFLGPLRERYALERLWQDAKQVPVAELIDGNKHKRPARRRPAKKKKTTAAGTRSKPRS